jgi:PhnB protein
MATLSPWINFNGNAEEAFAFYQSVFGGEFVKVVRFKDIATAEFPVPEKEANKIMYIALPIGNGTRLIANDVPEVMGKVNERENRSKILVTAESKEEAERLFNGLSVGGEVEGPMGEWIVEFAPTK